MKTLIIKKKLVRWDPNKKHPGGNLFFFSRVEPIVSPSCSPIDSQLPQLLRIHCDQPKKTEVPRQSFFYLGEF